MSNSLVALSTFTVDELGDEESDKEGNIFEDWTEKKDGGEEFQYEISNSWKQLEAILRKGDSHGRWREMGMEFWWRKIKTLGE